MFMVQAGQEIGLKIGQGAVKRYSLVSKDSPKFILGLYLIHKSQNVY